MYGKLEKCKEALLRVERIEQIKLRLKELEPEETNGEE